jgi:hypothetical protein
MNPLPHHFIGLGFKAVDRMLVIKVDWQALLMEIEESP